MSTNYIITSTGTFLSEDELAHHGIKGMKWGVRRYQNDDGSLTDQGVKRYAKKQYAKDSFNSNKTLAGKAWDAYTGAHKTYASAKYDTSTKEQNRKAAEKYKTTEDSSKNSHEKLKKAAKVGAVVAGSALAVYGGYKLSQYAKNKKASAKLVNNMLQKSFSTSTVSSVTEGSKNAMKAMVNNTVKSVDVPKVTVSKVTIPKTTVPTTTIPKATVSRATVNSVTSSTVKNGASAVKSTMSSYGSYDWDSLRKVNTNLLNQTLDDLLKGL